MPGDGSPGIPGTISALIRGPNGRRYEAEQIVPIGKLFDDVVADSSAFPLPNISRIGSSTDPVRALLAWPA